MALPAQMLEPVKKPFVPFPRREFITGWHQGGFIDRIELLSVVYPCIYLRRTDGSMPQKVPDTDQVDPGFHHEHRLGMPQRVRRDTCRDKFRIDLPGTFGILFHDGRYTHPGQFTVPSVPEKGIFVGVRLQQTMSLHIFPVSYTHLRAHETDSYLVCRLLLE